jgi:hypothetical protein
MYRVSAPTFQMSCGCKIGFFTTIKALLILFKLIFIGQAYSVAILKLKKSEKKEKHYYEQGTFAVLKLGDGIDHSLIF